MDNEINNSELKAAAEKMKANMTQENRLWFLQRLVGSSLILPVLIIPQPVNNVVAADATVNFFTMQTKAGQNYLATFTSMEEMNKWNKNSNKMYLVRSYESIKKLVLGKNKGYDGFVIDPCGCNVAVRNELIRNVERASNPTMTIKPEKIQTEGNMGLTPVDNPPEQLVKALTDYMSGRESINAAYIMQTVRKGDTKATLIVIVDFRSKGDGLKAEFDGVAAAAHTVIKKGESIGIMPSFDKAAHKSIQGVKPFYKK